MIVTSRIVNFAKESAVSLMLTQKRLKELLSYDPLTGIFTWVSPQSNRVRVGDRAGRTTKPNGYNYIGVEGKEIKVSRLAWFYAHGVWPEAQIDHVDGNRENDCLSNLREATAQQNAQNCKPRSSASGIRGVRREFGKWRAQIRVNGKQIHLGLYHTKEEASQAYLAARAEVFTFQPIPRESD